jgi:hypothetical protein
MPLAKTDTHANNPDGWAAVEAAPLFTGVSSEDFRRISAAARLRLFTRGEMLHLEGNNCQAALTAHLRFRENYPTGTERH